MKVYTRGQNAKFRFSFYNSLKVLTDPSGIVITLKDDQEAEITSFDDIGYLDQYATGVYDLYFQIPKTWDTGQYEIEVDGTVEGQNTSNSQLFKVRDAAPSVAEDDD